MSQKIINTSTPNDGLGDVLREGFNKTNDNFTELYNGKVDKVAGKGLSTNDFTNPLKAKLGSIEEGAQVNVQADFGENDPFSPAYIQNRPPSLYASVGFFDYNDLATQSVPLSVLANEAKKITNDTQGANTNLENPPYLVSGIWNADNNVFDFSQLAVGDTVDLRFDFDGRTTASNQSVKILATFGVGSPSEFTSTIYSSIFKSSGDHKIEGYTGFYMGSEDIVNYPAILEILSDGNIDALKINGFYTRIIRKNLNIIDIAGSGNIPTLDEVLEAGGYSERSATVGNFKAKEIQVGENFIPESSGALFRIQKNSDGTISIVFDSVSQTDSDNFGRLTSTFSNNDGFEFRHLENDNSQGAIARIRKDGILFTLINSWLKVNKDGVYRDILLSGLAEIADILGLQGALDNKADLVGGLVPQSQSQGSTLTMDSSTYRIEFTDARGNISTIDLPIESLFKDANYNSDLKTLFITLDNGSVIEVPLEDLVDLPEIQIAIEFPAVLPSDGQKVLFHYNKGHIYVNVDGEWQFFGKAISNIEFDQVTASYIHSIKTNENPHETKLVQLKDYSSAAYSEIIDTDSLLTYDVTTSLWKKFSFNNLKLKLKTYFDTIYATSSSVASQISTALASFKTANYLDATSSIQTQLDSKLAIETPTTTGVDVSFTQDRVYGSLATPETGNITANVTGAKLGVTNIIIHNSGTAPTFSSQFKKLSGSGNYVTGVINYIYVTYVSSTEIIYSINQRT